LKFSNEILFPSVLKSHRACLEGFAFFFGGGGAEIHMVDIPSSPEAVETAISDEFSNGPFFNTGSNPKNSFFFFFLFLSWVFNF
jgi:hypothetical protein